MNLNRFTPIFLGSLAVGGCGDAPGADSTSAARTSFVEAGPRKETGIGRIRRYSTRIVIPLGRTREEVGATLEKAARALADQTDADAVTVFGYRPGDPTDGIYTAGRAVYAPNGRWEAAGTDGPMEVTIDFAELYFAPPAPRAAIGDTLILENPYGERVSISRAYGSWGDEDIIGRVPNARRVLVLEVRAEPLGDQELIRYRIRTLGSGTTREGWIFKADTKTPPLK